MSTDGVVIRRARPEDGPAVERFYYEAYGDRARYKYPERWRWAYEENPLRDREEALPVYIAVAEDRVVGHTACHHVNCWMVGRRVPAVWAVDTIVLPAYRGRGVGGALNAANQSDRGLFMTLWAARASKRLKVRQGAHDGPATVDFACLVACERKAFVEQLHAYLGRRIGGLAWPVTAGFRLSGASHAASALVRRRLRQNRNGSGGGREAEFVPVEGDFGEEADELWGRVRRRFNFAVERDAAYLNWKYRRQPNAEYEAYYIFRGGSLRGLLIHRLTRSPEPSGGVIVELLLDEARPEAHAEAVVFSRDRLAESGAAIIRAAASTGPTQEALQAAGFVFNSYRPLVVSGRAAGALTPDTCAELTRGDQDGDQYPLFRGAAAPDYLQHISRRYRRSTPVDAAGDELSG